MLALIALQDYEIFKFGELYVRLANTTDCFRIH